MHQGKVVKQGIQVKNAAFLQLTSFRKQNSTKKKKESPVERRLQTPTVAPSIALVVSYAFFIRLPIDSFEI